MVSGVLPRPVGKRVAIVGDTHANAVWTTLKGLLIPEADERTLAQVRCLLGQVVEAIHSKLVVHGHWHHAFA